MDKEKLIRLLQDLERKTLKLDRACTEVSTALWEAEKAARALLSMLEEIHERDAS